MTEDKERLKLNISAIQWFNTLKGYYVLGREPYHMVLALDYKPSWIHRFFMRYCLGFVWKDKE